MESKFYTPDQRRPSQSQPSHCQRGKKRSFEESFSESIPHFSPLTPTSMPRRASLGTIYPASHTRRTIDTPASPTKKSRPLSYHYSSNTNNLLVTPPPCNRDLRGLRGLRNVDEFGVPIKEKEKKVERRINENIWGELRSVRKMAEMTQNWMVEGGEENAKQSNHRVILQEEEKIQGTKGDRFSVLMPSVFKF